MIFNLEEHGDPVRGYPALILPEVRIFDPDEIESGSDPLAGIIDTGCDFAVIPLKIANDLHLHPVDYIRAQTVTNSEMLPVYLIHMQSEGLGMLNTFAIGVENRDSVLIGRKCISHTKLTVDWPERKWSIEPVAPH